jgi:hypothetical protein
MMSAFGSAAAAIFGVFWTMAAMSMGAPLFFALFGVIFVALGIGQTIYNYKNATSKNRYSAFDITDGKEEPDPLNQYFGGREENEPTESGASASTEYMGQSGQGGATAEQAPQNNSSTAFCPYCGASVDGEFSFCPKCGKKLPTE